MNVLRASFLVLAGLRGVGADGYDLGGEDAICWLSQMSLATDNSNGTLANRVSSLFKRVTLRPGLAFVYLRSIRSGIEARALSPWPMPLAAEHS